ncbi:MAG: methyltransferase [Pseudomonadota bacterium]
MSDASAPWRGGWFNRLVARPGFQSWASRFPLTRHSARADGAAIFDIVQGFVASQALVALVELGVLERLRGGAKSAESLGDACDVPADRMEILVRAGTALGFLKRRRDGRFGLSRKGAAVLGVPGLTSMIRHHTALYDDLRDPVALLRGDTGSTQLAKFWPYVFGADGTVPEDVAETYSDLMAQSQLLVAQDTLQAVNLKETGHLLDIGGGTGAFLEAAGRKYRHLEMTLFDLPQVVQQARARFDNGGILERASIVPGSFRSDDVPDGADAISLVRVLYDHADDTVVDLLAKAYAALPEGGRLIVSEPMSGGSRPDRICDVYFAFYTMAMQTGRTRSIDEVQRLCEAVGFRQFVAPKVHRPFVTSVLIAIKT